ncbi:MAG TPA: hypothetical protein VGQ38_11945, partial [Gaiellaceae bacterium]|nr:hypothetical protein [Gaiellaceae bacterium]
MRDSYSFEPASTSPQATSTGPFASTPAASALATAIASASVTTDMTGTPQQITSNATNASPTTDTSVGVDPGTLAPGSTTTPTPVTADSTDAATAPAPSEEKMISSESAPDVSGASVSQTVATAPVAYESVAAPAAAPAPQPVSMDTNIDTVDDTTTAGPSVNADTPDVSTGDTTVTPDTPGTDPGAVDGGAVTGGAPTPSVPGATDDGTTVAPDSTTQTISADSPPVVAASDPGSARAPPSAWSVQANGSDVRVFVRGDNLVVTVDGNATQRALDDITTLDIVGAASLTVADEGTTWTYDGGAGTVTDANVPISFSGVASLNASHGTLHGPAADSTWSVTGDGSGTVGSATFSGFDNLVGAADNRDQFVFSADGQLDGGIDGGPGGYDTVVVDGGSYHRVLYRTVNTSSGSVVLDGNAIHYTGLEPVLVNSTATTQEYDGTTGPDAISISDDGNADSFTLHSSTSESITITNAHAIQELTIDALDDNDSFAFNSIDSAFGGSITVHGGTGHNTFIGWNGRGTWNLDGINSGTYRPENGPQISYDGFENLNGGSGDDTYNVGIDGGVTGSLTDAGGTSTLTLAGLLTVTGDGTFTASSNVGDKLSGGGTVTGLNVLAADMTNASVFLGVNYGTSDQAGVGHDIPDVHVALVTDGANSRAWAAAQASGGGVTVSVNTVAGDGTAIDFTNIDTNNDGTFGQELSGFSAAGADVSATFDHPSFDVAGLASGGADLVTVGGAIVDTTAIGPARSARIDLSATAGALNVGVSGFGVHASGDLGLELLVALGDNDSRRWYAAVGTGLSTTVALGPVSAALSGVSLHVNQASGATALQDWTTVGASSNFTFVSPGSFANVTGAVGSLDVAGVAQGAATSFTLTQQTVSNAPLSLTDAKLVTFGVTGLTGSLGTSGYGVTVSGDLTVSALADTSSTKHWLAAHGSALAIQVALAPLSFSASNGTLDLNRGFGASAIQDWSPLGVSLSFPVSGDYLDVTAQTPTITLGGFASASAASIDVSRTDGVTTPGGSGSLFALTLKTVSLNAGADGTTLVIDSGDVGAFALSDTTSTWFAFNGTGLHAHAALGPFDLTASGVSFKLNTHSAGAPTLTDWSTYGGPTFSSADDFELSATGGTTVTLTGVAHVSVGGFSLVRKTGVTGPGGASGTVFVLHLTGVTVDAGTTDLTLTLSNGSLDVYGFSTGSDRYLATTGSGFTVSAIAGPVHIGAGGAGFTLSSAPGTAPIDWSFADSAGPTIAANTFDVAASTGLSIVLGSDFASVSASSFHLSRDQGVTDPNGHGTGTVVHVSFTGLNLDASVPSITLTVDGGALDFILFAVGTSSWSMMQGNGFDVDLAAGPLSAAAHQASFDYNSESDPLLSPITNWQFARGPPSLQGDYFHLAATNGLSVSLTGLGSVTLSSLDLTRSNASATDETGATVAGTLLALHLTGAGLQLGSGAASLTLTGGTLDFASLVSGSQTWVAASGSTLGLSLTLGPLTASGSGLAFLYNSGPAAHEINDWTFAGITTSLADDLVKVSGSAAVALTGLFASVSVADFSATREPGSATDETGAAVTGQLFAVHLGGIDLQLGTGSASVHLTGGSLDVASLSNATSTWTAVSGSGFGLDVTLGPLSATGSNLAFLYNAGPAGHEINDWAFAGISTSLADDLVKVSGSATVTLNGLFASVSIADFALTRKAGSATDETGTSVSGQLFTLHLGGIDLQLGTGAASVSLTGGSLDVASLSNAT